MALFLGWGQLDWLNISLVWRHEAAVLAAGTTKDQDLAPSHDIVTEQTHSPTPPFIDASFTCSWGRSSSNRSTNSLPMSRNSAPWTSSQRESRK